MTIWYEVYENEERGSNEEQTIAFCKYKYSADRVSRYFPQSKIRKVREFSTWEWEIIKINESEE